MKALNLAKGKIKQCWLDLLTGSYLILTLILGSYSFFYWFNPSSAMILFFEISYLGVSLILTAVILLKINLFLVKIKRNNFERPPIKIQLHSFNLWAIALWTTLILVYGIQSAWTMFGESPLIIISPILESGVFDFLITLQFSLTIFLLLSMAVIFAYALVLHQQKNIKIKIIPNNFWAFESAQFKAITTFYKEEWTNPLFALFSYIKICLYDLPSHMLVLALELKHLKALELRQFKKETTPPSNLNLIFN